MIRETIRVITADGKGSTVAISAARMVCLQIGEFVFDPPDQSPGPNDISMTFNRLEGVTWMEPELIIQGAHIEPRLEAKVAPELTLSKKLSAWSSVTQIRVILHEGMNCRMLEMKDLVDCCEAAERGIKALGESLMRELGTMSRKSILCRVHRNATNPQKILLCFPRVDRNNVRWPVEKGLNVYLLGGGIFNGNAPPAKGKDVEGVWSARVVNIEDNTVDVAVGNELRNEKDPVFDSLINNVQLSVSEDDPMGDRLSKSIGRMGDCFEREEGKMSAMNIKDMPWFLSPRSQSSSSASPPTPAIGSRPFSPF